MRNTLQRFVRDRRGSIGLYMAVAVLPLTLLVGAATDFRRVESVRAALQDTTDAAILAGAKAYLATGETDPERLAAARAAAGATLTGNADFKPAMLTELTWDVANAADGGGELVLTSRGSVPLAFGGLFGMGSVPVKVSAASVVELRLEVALVLDTTGSMATNNRIGRLKTATEGLLNQLDAAARQSSRTNPLKVSLVPYSNTVRVPGAYTAGAEWLDPYSSGDGYWVTKPADLPNRLEAYGGAGWEGCVETRPMQHDVQDSPPSRSDPDTLFVPYFNPEGSDPNAGCEVSPVVELTRDTKALKQAVRGLRIGGLTNIPIGLAWGWHALTPGTGPFGAGAAEPYGKADLVKAVVLMTDGENNLGSPQYNTYTGVGRLEQERVGVNAASSFGERQAALDDRLRKLCANMKARGVLIYTVRVEEGSQELLRDCATQRPGEPPKYWNVTDAAQLPAVFNKIGQELIEVRLSR